MSSIWHTLISYFRRYLSISSVTVTDIIEIVIIAFIFYEVLVWFKKTRAWSLFKGILILLVLVLLAAILQFNTILWIASKTLSVGLIAIIVIFQPELRSALEQLGRGKVFKGVFSFTRDKEHISEKNVEEILEAVRVMADARTGALICLEKDVPLGEFEATGIPLDCEISRQVLINIFEDKTPLHDGAVIIKDNRITAATCYLPLSNDLTLNKKYGTRHRAAVGISEVSDSVTIVVSEETGGISLAIAGSLIENVTSAELKNRLLSFRHSSEKESLSEKEKKEAGDEDQRDPQEVDTE